MIFEVTNAKLQWFIDVFGDSSGGVLLFCAIMALIWFFNEAYRQGGFLRPKNEEWDRDEVTMVLKIMIYAGLILGLIVIGTAAVSLIYDIPPTSKYGLNVAPEADTFTVVLLFIMGLTMFLKPLQDIPVATIIGILLGIVFTIIVVALIPDNALTWASNETNIQSKWLFVGIFLIFGTLFGSMAKFWVDGFEAVGKFLSWPPIALLMSLICFVQAIGLIGWGWSISLLFA